MLKMDFVSVCLSEWNVRWGDHRISRPLYRGDRNILYLFVRGDRKINETHFARFFRPPPPVVNEPPLIWTVLHINRSLHQQNSSIYSLNYPCSILCVKIYLPKITFPVTAVAKFTKPYRNILG